MISTARSMRAWAIEASMSNSASRRSKETEAVKRCTSSVAGSLKRPDHGWFLLLSLADMRPVRI
ncbi:hypothetical protein D3C83_10120 [compost metagenome]